MSISPGNGNGTETSSTTVYHTFYSITTYQPNLADTTLTKSSTALVHTDVLTIHTLLTSTLPSLIDAQQTFNLLPPSPSLPHSSPSRFVFSHDVQTGTAKSGKKLKTPFHYSLLLTSNPSLSLITISTDITDSNSSSFSPTPISGFISLVAAPHNTTQVTLSTSLLGIQQHEKASGSSNSKAEAPLNHLLSLIPALHTRFARYDEVDQARYEAFEKQQNSPPPILPHEDNLVTASATDTGGWKRVAGTVRESVSYFNKTENNDNWAKAVANVDAPASLVFSYMFGMDSYRSALNHVDKEGAGAFRKVVYIPNSRSMFLLNLVRFGAAVSNRFFSTWFAWHKESDGSFTLAFTPLEDHDDKEQVAEMNAIVANDPLASAAIRGNLRGCWRFKPLAPTVCQITYVLQAQLGGSIPKQLLAMRTKHTLGVVQATKDQFERKGVVVDAEVRAAFLSPPPLEQLDDEQRSIVGKCVALEPIGGRPSRVAWTPVRSTSPFVKMWLRFPETEGWGRTLAVGRASATLDCSPLEALAWWFDFASRSRVKLSNEEGNPARVVWKENGPHDNIVATIKQVPFPLQRREFVARQLCAIDDGVLSFFTESADEKVDYGSKKLAKAVRASTTAMARFKPVEGRIDQCELLFVQHFDLSGHVPAYMLNSKLPAVLNVAASIRERFNKDDEIDEADLAKLALAIVKNQQTYTQKEDALIERVKHKLHTTLKEADFGEMESPDHLVSMGRIFLEESGLGTGRAGVTVDASIEECAAWEMAVMSRERVRVAGSSRAFERSLTRINDHNGVFHVVMDFEIPGLKPREFIQPIIWKWGKWGDTLAVVYDTFTEHADFAPNPTYVQAKTMGYYEYEKLRPAEGFPQTRVTWTQQVDLRGFIPKLVVNGKAVNQLMHLSAMRKRFDKSSEIDNGTKQLDMAMISNSEDTYSAAENNIVEEGKKLFTEFAGTKAKNLNMKSSLTRARIAFKDGDRRAWGWATTSVRTSPREALAYLWNTHRRNAQRKKDLEKTVEERPNDHNLLLYRKVKAPSVLADRDFLYRTIWRKESDGSFLLVTCPEESEKRPINSSAVRAQYRNAIRFKRKNAVETTVEQLSRPDLGGAIPAWVMTAGMSGEMMRVTQVQEFFQESRRFEVWDGDDGRAVGEAMCIIAKAEKHRERGESKVGARMRELFKKHKGLGEIAKKHEFFQPMMVRVVENKLRPAGTVNTPLCDLSKREGGVMARGLAMAMASNLTAEAGVDQWLLQHSALIQFDKEEAFFRPMMNVVGKRLLGEVSWGLKMRVIMGAGLSVLDMATDVFVIMGYMGEEETRGYGWILLWMIAGSLAIQLLVAFGQNRKKPLKMLGEMLIVLTGMKPGFDAFSVCSGKEMDEHGLMDAKAELVVCKGIEMVCESIPGCILQLYAILKSGDRSRRVIVSVAVSALTTGFISASISFDFDVDPQKRKEAPEFYGYIPDDGKRTVIFGCMVLNSALLLLVRSLSAAMLILVKKRYLAIYMAGDMAMYLLQKVARGDFHYWFPIDGALGLLASLLVRVLAKTIIDFTGVIHFRHPYELGGLYWTGNMVLALLASFASVWIYTKSDGAEVTKREAWTLVSYMGGGWLTAFGLFLLLMKKEYRRTFFSTKSGAQNTMNYFMKGADESVKSIVITDNKLLWRPIRGEVKTWVLGNWYKWVEERPAWFTEAWVNKVPDDFIPDDEDQAKLADIRMKGRLRSSSGAALGPAKIHPVGITSRWERRVREG